MCGIAGEIVDSDHRRCGDPGRVEDVARMVAAMRSRGPDDQGQHVSDTAVLGMCRLAIIDVAGGHQPISTADGRYQIVYNGECYGVAELRDELESLGHRFRTRTDTEVVLHAFLQWGPDGLHRLNGMFAVAIWDRDERELFLARDRLGIKPLFYWAESGRLVFSSTLGGIRARSDFEGTIDPEAVELFLATKFVTAPHTMFREVRKLPAGHWARWKDGELTVRQWWDVPLSRSGSLDIDANEAGRRVIALLEDATRKRLVSERSVGLCLSGGIDSGLLASVLAGDDIEAFSMGFREKSFDESSAAKKVAERYGLRHHVLMGELDPLRDFSAVVASYDEPVADNSGVALYNLSRLISEHVTVVLSGTGGDELFGGYRRYVGARMAQLLRFVPGLQSLPKLLRRDESKLGWRGQLARLSEAATVPPIAALERLISPASPDLGRALRRPEFVHALGGFRSSTVFEEPFARAEGCSLLTRLMYADLKTVLVDDYLVKEDRMTMAHSIEGRVPFLDHRLVELAYSLPDHLKIRGLKTKLLLRKLAESRLPKAVAHGPKQGFEIPAAQWLRGPLSGLVREQLLEPDARICEYTEPAVVTRLVHEHLGDRANHSRLLWSLLTLETWLREAT